MHVYAPLRYVHILGRSMPTWRGRVSLPLFVSSWASNMVGRRALLASMRAFVDRFLVCVRALAVRTN
jgi:hypothetical protein